MAQKQIKKKMFSQVHDENETKSLSFKLHLYIK